MKDFVPQGYSKDDKLVMTSCKYILTNKICLPYKNTYYYSSTMKIILIIKKMLLSSDQILLNVNNKEYTNFKQGNSFKIEITNLNTFNPFHGMYKTFIEFTVSWVCQFLYVANYISPMQHFKKWKSGTSFLISMRKVNI